MSEADIAAGQRWLGSVGTVLQEANFGILCLTRDNLSAPWLLFEAGALAKSLDEAAVCPLLLDLQFGDLTGPLAQFQAKKMERAGIFELVSAINQFSGEKLERAGIFELVSAINQFSGEKLELERLRKLFDLLWPEFAEALAAIPGHVGSDSPGRDTSEVLEDLVSSIRRMEAQVADLTVFAKSSEEAGADEDSARITRNKSINILRRVLKAFSPVERTHLAKNLGLTGEDLDFLTRGNVPSEAVLNALMTWYRGATALDLEPVTNRQYE